MLIKEVNDTQNKYLDEQTKSGLGKRIKELLKKVYTCDDFDLFLWMTLKTLKTDELRQIYIDELERGIDNQKLIFILPSDIADGWRPYDENGNRQDYWDLW